ncbi:callose synthase 5-like protein [Tanacetum coccineum]
MLKRPGQQSVDMRQIRYKKGWKQICGGVSDCNKEFKERCFGIDSMWDCHWHPLAPEVYMKLDGSVGEQRYVISDSPKNVHNDSVSPSSRVLRRGRMYCGVEVILCRDFLRKARFRMIRVIVRSSDMEVIMATKEVIHLHNALFETNKGCRLDRFFGYDAYSGALAEIKHVVYLKAIWRRTKYGLMGGLLVLHLGYAQHAIDKRAIVISSIDNERFKMPFEFYGMLTGNVSIVTGENVEPSYGGAEEAFLRKVLTPIYQVIDQIPRPISLAGVLAYVRYILVIAWAAMVLWVVEALDPTTEVHTIFSLSDNDPLMQIWKWNILAISEIFYMAQIVPQSGCKIDKRCGDDVMYKLNKQGCLEFDLKRFVPSCFVIFDLEPLSLSLTLSLVPRSLNLLLVYLYHLFHLANLCLD